MKSLAILISSTAVALMAGTAQAAEQTTPQQIASGESFEQKCGRWADYQSLKDSIRAEYITDCVRELRLPDKAEDGGDD